MMNFRIIKQAIVDVLGAAAANRFQVIGFQRQTKDAEEVKGNNRLIQVWYSGGDFSRSSGRQTGPSQHKSSFKIGLTVSAPANVNLSAINSPSASPAQIAAALAGLQESAYEVDTQYDELLGIVYQILMDGRNFDLQLEKGMVSSRWIDSMRKDDPQPNGSLVVLTGIINYSCNTVEEVVGDTGVACKVISTVVDIKDDDVEKTGVEVII